MYIFAQALEFFNVSRFVRNTSDRNTFTITISGSKGIINTYKLEMLQIVRFEKDWVELYFARDMGSILKTMKDLIDFELKKEKSHKLY